MIMKKKIVTGFIPLWRGAGVCLFLLFSCTNLFSQNYYEITFEGTGNYEFDFRHNERMILNVTDAERTVKAIKGAVGKRLTYDQPRSRSA